MAEKNDDVIQNRATETLVVAVDALEWRCSYMVLCRQAVGAPGLIPCCSLYFLADLKTSCDHPLPLLPRL